MNDSQFQIIGTKIYDPNGQEFILKGTNMFAWEGIDNVDNYLNTWGFNTIRVPNYLLGSYDQPHPAEDGYITNHQIVDAYTSQGAVVIFDAHDLIGSYYEDNNWEVLKDYWQDMAQEFKDNPHVWFNLHNEPGNATADSEQWVSYHRELIDIIRAEGADNLIVIDGEAWGQDYHTQTIASHASEVMAGNENILFSIHVYDQWNSNDIAAYFDLLHSQDIPFIVGEYGSENNGQSTLAATEQMLQAAQEQEIGRIVWAAKADDNNDLTTVSGGHAEYFDGSNTELLTDLGELVWNDLQRTEDLEQLEGYEGSNNNSNFTNGVFEVDSSGQVQFDFLFDGGWFQGELAVFSLEGMEAYVPGSQEFIQAAALRALTNSEQGQILLRDRTEGAKFSSSLPWENDFNAGDYLGQKSFSMTPGDRFAVNDTLIGSKERDILYGSLGQDKLSGRNNDDMLFGDEDDDVLNGNRGDDILVGGLGNDTLKGGDGSDLFVLANDGGVDRIKDFEIGQDLIQLSGNFNFKDIVIMQGKANNREDSLIINSDNNQLIAILSNVEADNLTAVDFID